MLSKLTSVTRRFKKIPVNERILLCSLDLSFINGLQLEEALTKYIPALIIRQLDKFIATAKYLEQIKKYAKERKIPLSANFKSYLTSGKTALLDLTGNISGIQYRYHLRWNTGKARTVFIEFLKILYEKVLKYANNYKAIALDLLWDLTEYLQTQETITKNSIRSLPLNVIYHILDKEPQLLTEHFSHILITLKVKGDYLTVPLYVKGDILPLSRLLSLANKWLQLHTDEELKEKLERKVKRVEKLLKVKVKQEDKVNAALTLLTAYFSNHIDELSQLKLEDLRQVKQVIIDAAAEFDIPVDPNKPIDEILDELVEYIPPRIKLPEAIHPDEKISEIVSEELELGSAFSAKEKMYLSAITDLLKAYNKYFKQKYNIVITRIKLYNSRYNDVERSELITLELTLKDLDNNKTFKVQIDLPKLIEGKYFYYNGKKRVLVYQLFQSPIITVKPFDTILRTNYTTIRFRSKLKNKHRGLYAYVLGKEIPALLLLACDKDKCSLKDIFKQYNANVYISDSKPDHNYYIELSNGKYLVLENIENELAKQLFWAFKTWLGKKKVSPSIYESCDALQQLLILEYGKVYVENLKYLYEVLIDPIIEFILYTEDLPRNPRDLFTIAMYECISGKTVAQTDLAKRRVRAGEVVAVTLFKKLNPFLYSYKIRKKGKPEVINVPRDIVLKEMLASELQSQFQLVEDVNPYLESSYFYRLTYAGLQGLPPEMAGPQVRTNHPTYYGNIDPIDTPDSDKVGVLRHLAVDADLISLAGKFLIKDPLSVKNIFSPATSFSPVVLHNDGNRVQFMTAQARSDIPIISSEVPLLMSTYNFLISFLSSNEFALKAEDDGKVLKVTDNYIVVYYPKQKKKVVYPLKTKRGESDVLITQVPRVNEGDTVKKGQILAEHPYFFKNGIYTPGINAYTVVKPHGVWNFEDALVISQSFANKLTSVHMYEKVVAVAEDELISYVNLNVGQPVTKKDVLIKTSKNVEFLSESHYQYLLNEDTEDLEDLFDEPESSDYDGTNTVENDNSEEESGLLETTFGKVVFAPEDGILYDVEVYAKNEATLKKYEVLYKFWKNKLEKIKQEIEELRKLGADTSILEKEYERILNPFGKTYKGEPIENILIKFKIKSQLAAQIGDKLHNYSGNICCPYPVNADKVA